MRYMKVRLGKKPEEYDKNEILNNSWIFFIVSI